MSKKPSPKMLALQKENESLKKENDSLKRQVENHKQKTQRLDSFTESIMELLTPEIRPLIEEEVETVVNDLHIAR